MKVLLLAATISFLLVAGVSEASACSCLAPLSVPEEFAASPIVATAKIDRFEELDRTVAGTNVYKTVAAVMTVDKVYKGTLKAGQSIRVLSGGGGDCSMSLVRESPGQRFLFYTTPARPIGKLKGRLHWISLCSRSARIESAGPDLVYLDNRVKLAGKTRLSGAIKRFSPEPPSLAHIKVSVTGANFEKTVETDENGFFDLWELPPGKYHVTFQVPSGMRISDYKINPADKSWRRQTPPDNTIEMVIVARRHTEVTVGINNAASGN